MFRNTSPEERMVSTEHRLEDPVEAKVGFDRGTSHWGRGQTLSSGDTCTRRARGAQGGSFHLSAVGEKEAPGPLTIFRWHPQECQAAFTVPDGLVSLAGWVERPHTFDTSGGGFRLKPDSRVNPAARVSLLNLIFSRCVVVCGPQAKYMHLRRALADLGQAGLTS